MDIDAAIKGRRSIRKYQKQDVPDSIIAEILDLAGYAPSSMDGQPCHFIVVKKEAIKKRLLDIKNKYCPPEKQAFQADFLQAAPLIIIVCVDQHKSYDRGMENGILAAMHILLAAYSRGLGSVYMSAYKAGDPGVVNETRQALGLPENIDPVSIIPLGYPDELPQARELRPLEDMLHYEKF